MAYSNFLLTNILSHESIRFLPIHIFIPFLFYFTTCIYCFVSYTLLFYFVLFYSLFVNMYLDMYMHIVFDGIGGIILIHKFLFTWRINFPKHNVHRAYWVLICIFWQLTNQQVTFQLINFQANKIQVGRYFSSTVSNH